MYLSEMMQAGGLFQLAPLIIAFPILGMLINIAVGRRMSEKQVGIVASTAVGLSFLIAILQFIALKSVPEGARVMIADWIQVGALDIPWALRVDTLSVTMMLMVAGVSALIHIYAIGYMHRDVRHQGFPERYSKFFVFFNLFVASMMILVSADNMLMMFVGWEGVGLCSYLLIGFWYEKGKDGIGNAIAGKKAFIVNRIGDFGFIVAMFLTFYTFGSLQFEEILRQVAITGEANQGAITAIALFLLLGATGKSAQIPLFVWLPDAMAGPTPVSALIHAATMVTAGIYMITRNSALFNLAPASANLVALVGGTTALFAATIAVGQFDIKKVLAYSTISQLGFMIAAVGMGAYVAGIFHLVTHAFFKALLFLSAGSVIQGIEQGAHDLEGHDEGGHHDFNPQDMRNMGGLRSRMKITYCVYLIGALTLAGIPPLAGFFSKDEILADASHINTMVYVFLVIAAFLTAFYMGRQIFMVFWGKARSDQAAHAKENPPVMTIPLMVLAAGAALGGVLNLPGMHSLNRWLEHTLGHLHVSEFNFTVAGISTALAIAAIGIAWLIYGRKTLEKGEHDPLRRILGPVFVGMENKWWVDEAYEFLFIHPYFILAKFLAWFDIQVIDGAINGLARLYNYLAGFLGRFDMAIIDGAINGLGRLVTIISDSLRGWHRGFARNYALPVVVGVILVMTYFIFR